MMMYRVGGGGVNKKHFAKVVSACVTSCLS